MKTTRVVAVAITLVTVFMGGRAASGAEPKQGDMPSELWRAYPLHPHRASTPRAGGAETGQRAPRMTPRPAPSPPTTKPPPPHDQTDVKPVENSAPTPTTTTAPARRPRTRPAAVSAEGGGTPAPAAPPPTSRPASAS